MLNGKAVTWYSDRNWTNAGMSKDEIYEDLYQRMSILRDNPPEYIYKNKHRESKIPVSYESIRTEQEAAESFGLRYLHLIVRDHTRASDDAVDQFVEFVKDLDDNAWLHFHCSAGRGRTTTFMALYDIMKNGEKVSLKDIVRRQHYLGGLNLFAVPSEHDWQYPHALARAELIRDFYQYAKENPDFSIRWSEWIHNKTEAKN